MGLGGPPARALITGIGGQDGSYLAEQLVAEGVEVHALARLEDGPPAYCPDAVTVHIGDLTDIAGVRRLVMDLVPGEIYNLAALSSVAASWEQPDVSGEVNGSAAAALLESALLAQEHHGTHVHVVQASSAEMFGNPSSSPQDETTPLAPVSPYGAAKAFAHLMVGVYRGRGLAASSLILYNHESPRRPTRFVTRKITAGVAAIAHGNADRLVLGNLEARRDWGWAPDYTDAMVRAARSTIPADYVIATGQSHSVRDFVASAFTRAGISDWEHLVQTDPALVRPADAVDLCGDASKARRDLGWSATLGFDDVVAAMVDHDLAGLP